MSSGADLRTKEGSSVFNSQVTRAENLIGGAAPGSLTPKSLEGVANP